jgi:SAM-dependent methyltransferase
MHVLEAPPIEAEALPSPLRRAIVSLPADPVRERFLSTTRPVAAGRRALHGVLRRFASDFDVNAWLGTYEVCLLGRGSFEVLLEGAPRGSLLDVGAGSGAITAELASLFSRVVVTETSRGMARRLAGRWETHAIDLSREPLPSEARFDVVSLLHVLDRAARPRTLLARAKERVAEGGRLLVACPLPFRPHVDLGGATSDPDEWVEADGTFEQALVRLVDTLFTPLGLEVERLARTTYLSQGDARAPFYALDDAILVCRVTA